MQEVKMLSDVGANGSPQKGQICCRIHWPLGSSAGCGPRVGASGQGSSASACLAGWTLRHRAGMVDIAGHDDPHGSVAAPILRFWFFQDRTRQPRSDQVWVNRIKRRLTGQCVLILGVG